MGRSLSPILRRELENLDKDADSRKSAMKALKSYVKDLDSTAIPLFLAQVSQSKQTGVSSGEHTISLYEVLARVHGPKIVPQIENIMSTIIKTLSSSAGAFALHQACSKVVPAIARYGMDPTTADDKKRFVIHSLCKPLSDCLLGSQENLSSGAALCLQALVESDNWRFSSNEMVNEVCQRVAGALEKHSLTNSHMALVTALAKNNSLIVEAYARLLIVSGLRILEVGFLEANSQKQLSAIHMVSSLMRCLDPKSILSELELVIKEMEKCQSESERMPFVTGAAFEALQIARRICAEKGSKFERETSSDTGSKFERTENIGRRNASYYGNQSPLVASPESQAVDYFVGHDYSNGSPLSVNHAGYTGSDRKSVNRKVWRRCEYGALDVSLKDGIFSEITRGSDMMSSEYDEFSDNHDDHYENFAGFVQGSSSNGVMGSNTPSPQRSNSRINVEDVRIFTTPRKLIRSLQDQDDVNSDYSIKQARRFRSRTPRSFALTPTSNHNSNENLSSGSEQFHGSSESVEDLLTDKDLRASLEEISRSKSVLESTGIPKKHHRSAFNIVCGLCFALMAVFLCLMTVVDQDDQYILVPT